MLKQSSPAKYKNQLSGLDNLFEGLGNEKAAVFIRNLK